MFDIDELNELVLNKYIKVKKHPEFDLYLYDYSVKTQYERFWNEYTLACRGLIMDNDGTIKARPFPKFFNYGEPGHETLPNESYQVFDKLDGSLGIMYWWNDEPYIATRGSFESEQALKATQWLRTKYAHIVPKLDASITYLFEIIYPSNRIVVDYGDRQELVLIGMIDTKTGKELPLQDIGFTRVKEYDANLSINALQEENEANREGYVLKFESGYRIKVKFEEYVRLHRILTEITTYSIWEMLKEGQSLYSILEKVPDEFYDWVRKVESELNTAYKAIEDQCKLDYKEFATRKETAAYFMTCQYPKVLFFMLDKRDLAPVIWKSIKPQYAKPFIKNKEE